LHHSDILTYALTRLAAEYARDKVETLKDLRRYTQDGNRTGTALGQGPRSSYREGLDYSIPAPKSSRELPNTSQDD
jgi:hypothetical protein